MPNILTLATTVVFVHLIKEFKVLEDIDALLLNLWKLFKYSSVKASVFEQSQLSEGLNPLKILKAATTRWLTLGEADQRVIK